MGLNQTDVSAFLAFTEKSSFSKPVNEPFDDFGGSLTQLAVNPLSFTFNAYLISSALAQKGWRILMVPGVDQRGITNTSTPCPKWAVSGCREDPNLGCSGYRTVDRGYRGYKLCDSTSWYYSTSQNTAYTLFKEDRIDPPR